MSAESELQDSFESLTTTVMRIKRDRDELLAALKAIMDGQMHGSIDLHAARFSYRFYFGLSKASRKNRRVYVRHRQAK